MIDRLHLLDNRLEAVKKRKLLRDMGDFQKGHIFSWPKNDITVKNGFNDTNNSVMKKPNLDSLDDFPEINSQPSSRDKTNFASWWFGCHHAFF